MKLNLAERFKILQILPKEGNFVTLNIVGELQKELAPSEEEFKEFEITQKDTQITWNIKGSKEKEIKVGEKASDIISEELEKLDKENKLTAQDISIYKKFVKNKD